MKINWRTEILPLFCVAASIVLAIAALPHAPDRIPIHWGLSGQPNGYAGRFWGLFASPLIMAGAYLLLLFLPRIDPRRYNYAKFGGAYQAIRIIILLALLGLQLITVLWALGVEVNMNVTVFIIIGLLLMLLGNFFGKIRPNWFVGIRLPWTLSSEESWNKTHRLGGRLFVLFGLAMVVAAPFQNKWAHYILGAGLVLILVILSVYAYRVWKQDPKAHNLSTRS